MTPIAKAVENASCSRRAFLIAISAGGVGAGASTIPAIRADAAELPGPLVSARWLHAHRSDVTVIGIRGTAAEFTMKPEYGAPSANGEAQLIAVGGHIPDARLIVLSEILATRRIDGRDINDMPPTAEALQSALRRAGVGSGKPLVIASAGDSVVALDFAARLYWTLKTFGSADIAVLNGGMAAWLEAGYPASTAQTAPAMGDWTAAKANWRWFASSEDAARASAGDGVQLVDARPTSQFLGITKALVVREFGHIKGAKSFPPEAIARRDGIAFYFMGAAEYRKILPELGIDADAPTIAYCNTGIYSSGAWFVLHEIVGNPNVRLYVGSMQEWTLEGRPVVR